MLKPKTSPPVCSCGGVAAFLNADNRIECASSRFNSTWISSGLALTPVNLDSCNLCPSWRDTQKYYHARCSFSHSLHYSDLASSAT